LDNQWRLRDDKHPHAPMVCHSPLGSWSQHVSWWNAALRIWRLVDLTKHPKLLERIKEKYVGQDVTERGHK